MKTTNLIAFASLLSTLFIARGEPFRTDLNPALLYYQAFLLDVKPLTDADWDYLGSKAGREQKLPERFGPILAGYDNEFNLVREAAQQKVPCDWGIDLSAGPNTILPHLVHVKAVAQAAQVRAIWDLQHGNQTAARDDLLAAFVLARNTSRDGTVIGALVQQACEAIIFATVAGNFGQFSPETLKQLEAGFEAAPPLGTITKAIMTENKNHADWQVREFKIEAWQAMMQAAIEYKLHGEAGLKSVPDPFGNGPFTFQRFVFESADRGFELKSAYTGLKYPCALIFVEKEGPPFRTDGPYIGRAVQP